MSDTLRVWGHESIIDEVSLAVSELVANAVIHAQSKTSLTLLDRTNGIQVRLRDISPDLPEPRVASSSATNGRGLQIVERLAENWGVEQTPPGKVIWVDLRDADDNRGKAVSK